MFSQFFDLYKIIEQIGQVAYKLEFPFESRIHPIFHISFLKKKIMKSITPTIELFVIQEDKYL